MNQSKLNSFGDAVLRELNGINGGSGSTKPECCCPEERSKGNNGIGQEKRGILDGPPPGLAKQERLDFNDRSGNRHGVEV